MGDPNGSAIPASAESNVHPGTNEADHVGDKFEVPAYEEHSSFDGLKQRIRHHYELASDYYYSLW